MGFLIFVMIMAVILTIMNVTSYSSQREEQIRINKELRKKYMPDSDS